jgi:endonuclease V-like protein UPF0215 family
MESQYERVGQVTHYYAKAGVAIIELSSPLRKGEKIVVRGSTTRVEQVVDSMELNHIRVDVGQRGQMVGLRMVERVREHDVVYRVKQ